MIRLHQKLFFKILLCLVFTALCLSAQTREFEGTVSKKEDNILTIKFESDWAPQIGDAVKISTSIAGRVLSGGKAEVTEVGEGFVKAKVLSGKPNIRMSAVIVSENPVPVNLSAEDAYEQGLKLYLIAVLDGEDYLTWNARVDTKSESYLASIPLLKLAAENDHPEACFLYSKHFYAETFDIEKFNKNEPQEENTWLNKAVSLNSPPALFTLGRNYSLGLGVERDTDKAQSYFKRAADLRHLESLFELSMLTKDLTTSKNYRIKAAEGGLLRAQEMVGQNYLRYADGEGFAPYNLEQAVYWLTKAVDQGSADSMFRLGDLYFNGGVHFPIHDHNNKDYQRMGADPDELRRQNESRKLEKNLPKAISYYEQAIAADLYLYDAHHRLGQLYSTRGTEFFDEVKAFQWFVKGADEEKLNSIVALARCYRLGIGTEPSPEKAFKLASDAHERWGNIDNTKLELALCYRDGIGTQVDYNKAIELLTPIIEKEYKPSYEAMVHLGDMYRNGQGYTQDYTRALYWYYRALDSKPSSGLYENNERIKAMAYARIARAYAYGEGREKQMNLVFENSSAALGLDPYQALALRCGGIFLNSFREKENKIKAAGAFEKAANLGDIESSFLLGEMYNKGTGVDKDKETAITHYHKAARSGHEKSQKALQKLKASW